MLGRRGDLVKGFELRSHMIKWHCKKITVMQNRLEWQETEEKETREEAVSVLMRADTVNSYNFGKWTGEDTCWRSI